MAGSAERGAHTLRVLDGEIIGVEPGGDVFVELGPRMQGVIDASAFAEAPQVGDVHSFTLHGQEEELWALSLVEEPTLATWEDLEVGSVVHARVLRTRPGGLEVRVGPLHAFLPRSQTGLDRRQDPAQLVGKTLACEVTEIDAERQRCAVSRKLVLQRSKESGRLRQAGALAPGTVVQGRVTRVEDYGLFLRFGSGLEGLVHVSNLAWDRVGHPSEVAQKGDTLSAKVLYVKQGGKRIGLGVKQMSESPWDALDREQRAGDLVEGTVTRVAEFGLFVRVRSGVEGLVHRSETGLGDGQPLARVAKPGDAVSVRVVSIDPVAERLGLSLLHASGRPIAREEAAALREQGELPPEGGATTSLARKLREAFGGPASDGDATTGPAPDGA